MLQKIKGFLFKNTTARQTVAKNTIWLSISNFGGRAIKAALVIYAARALGTAGYGVFSYAITLAGFFTLFIDPGINFMMMREVSQSDDARRRGLLSTMFVMKLGLIFITVLFVLFIAPFFSILPGSKILLPIAAMIITVDTLREFFSAFMRSRERMEWDAAAFLTTNAVVLITGFTLLFISKTPTALMWAYVLGSAAGLIVALFGVRDHLRKIFSHVSTQLIGPIIQSAWPFAITGALGSLLTSADIFIISFFKSSSDVGIYSAAVRIVQVLYLVPVVFQFSILPLLGRLARQDDARFRTIFEQILAIVFLFSVPIAIGGIILGGPIMAFVFGNSYAPGGLSFQLLMATLLFDFPIAIISNAIFAYDHQKSLIVSSIIGGVLNVVLDILFIPRFGIAGSAVATLIAQAASNWYLWDTLKKLNYFEVLPRLKKIAVAGITMGLATIALYFIGTELIINILLSALVYLFVLFILRETLLGEVKRTLFGRPAVAAAGN